MDIRVLITYASTYGSPAEIAKRIGAQLRRVARRCNSVEGRPCARFRRVGAALLAASLAALLALFATDAFSQGLGRGASVLAFLIQLLPSTVLVGLLVLAWRRPRLGGSLFIILAVGFGLGLLRGGVVSFVLVTLPTLVTGLLFTLSPIPPER